MVIICQEMAQMDYWTILAISEKEMSIEQYFAGIRGAFCANFDMLG